MIICETDFHSAKFWVIMKEGINCHIKLGSLESESRTGKEECLNAIDMAIKAKV